MPRTADPKAIRHLPAPVHDAYVSAFSVSLRPVFLVGAAVAVAAFLLTWLLREVPLRKVTAMAAAEAAGESRGLAAAPPGAAPARASGFGDAAPTRSRFWDRDEDRG